MMNVLSLFDGISCGRIAIERAGIYVNNYYSSEIDSYAIKISDCNWKWRIKRIGDVNNWKKWKLPKIDLLLAGSPCQGFSFAGNQLAFDDNRSKLYFKFEEILKEINPKYFLLENVKMNPLFIKTISDRIWVNPIIINSKDFSAQNRERLYWTNIKGMVKKPKKPKRLSDIIGEHIGVYVKPRGYNTGGVKYKNDISPCLTASSWQHNFFIETETGRRKFTPEEAEMLQTLPVGYTDYVSENQRFKAIGNAWTVDVITSILKNIKL